MDRDSPTVARLNLSPRYGLYRASWAIAIAGWIVSPIVGSLFVWQWASPSADGPFGPRFAAIGSIAIGVLLVVLAILPFVMRASAIAAGGAAYDAEEAWLRSLPFHVGGYMKIIGRRRWMKSAGSPSTVHGAVITSGSHNQYFVVLVRVSHTGERPTEQALHDLVARFGKPLTVKNVSYPDDKRHAREYELRYEGQSTPQAVAGTRRLVRELFVPLHDKYPIGAVELSIDNE
jgi:hypothetical protein